MNRQFNEPTQGSKNMWVIIVTMVITVVVISGGVYYWQRSKAKIEIEKLQNQIVSLGNNAQQLQRKLMFIYLDKLKDPNYTSTYGHGYIWYIAAEELGNIGKPAIPYLIEKLNTKDDYERTQTLYALMLAAQHENVKIFTGGEYVKDKYSSAFPLPERHPDLIKAWEFWYEKYKDNWE